MATTAPDPITPRALSCEDRYHGLIALNLIGKWDDWVKRRVESIEFISDTTVRRSVSVDFRIRSWLPNPALDWDGDGVYYFPLAMLKKQAMVDFDLHDEKGHSLSLLTRNKNSAIAAGTLSSLAQLTIWTALGKSVGFDALAAGKNGMPKEPRQIQIPRAIEDDFMRIAYLRPDGAEGGGSSRDVADRFLSLRPTNPRPLVEWGWSQHPELETMAVADADEAEWRWQLADDPRLRDLMTDLGRLWMVTVPIRAQSKMRRIVKFQYQEARVERRPRMLDRRRKMFQRLRLFDSLARLEDHIEGLPVGGEADGEWTDHRDTPAVDEASVGLGERVLRGLGWRGHDIEFFATAVGEGGSYHLEVQAPEGTQIRRASLEAIGQARPVRTYALRGARSLQRAHLYVGDVMAGANGRAYVLLKPRTTTIIRGLCLLALASALTLALAGWQLPILVDNKYGRSANMVPLLLILPSVLAAAIARTGENSMTTAMVFGLRGMAALVAFWPLAAAALLAVARKWPPLDTVWWILVGGATASFVILAVSWRLNGRRRPDGTAP